MPRLNPFQSFTDCWRYAMRRAIADGDTFHVVATTVIDAPYLVLSDRDLFARDDFAPEDIEATIDPFLPGFGTHARE